MMSTVVDTSFAALQRTTLPGALQTAMRIDPAFAPRAARSYALAPVPLLRNPLRRNESAVADGSPFRERPGKA